MKKPVRIAIIALAVIIALMTMYLVVPGFTKMGNVFIVDFSVSEDGSEMTVTVGVSSSIGYVRKVSEHQQQGGKLYLDCYSAFGGINGSWGAKNEYTIQLDDDTDPFWRTNGYIAIADSILHVRPDAPGTLTLQKPQQHAMIKMLFLICTCRSVTYTNGVPQIILKHFLDLRHIFG